MISPNMATMLGFVITDADVDPADWQAILRHAADRSMVGYPQVSTSCIGTYINRIF